ncbi:MAG: peptide chain release factor 3 [Deltaproteobacteria bacterium]|nr:MAG: peptide chain release factor 3 [Deltaproteobacteria bacterium]
MSDPTPPVADADPTDRSGAPAADGGAGSLAAEARRRRTFGIISHPDAGKTTLTEKLLLYSGAIHLAGSVKGRKAGRLAVSDWMKMEQERGISITSSVLQFEYRGAALNLLDTPGHADFSEDTYRTLAAVDSAVMLIDHAKGVESRTRKLFEVCRMRRLPVITFMNKLDRAGLDPLELLDDVSSTLNLQVAPLTWPIGMGRDFKGVVDVRTREVILYQSEGRHGAGVLDQARVPFDDARDLIGDATHDEVAEQLELLEIAGDPWDTEAFLAGGLSAVFWGSAMTNFGVEPLLRFLAESAAPPHARTAVEGDDDGATVRIEPTDDVFTGFIFKIQANMNPRHRDRVAFMRVVSGRFERGMDIIIGRSGETLRLAKPHSFMADERSIVETAWPGDIVGLHDPGRLRIGDTLAAGRRLRFEGIPRFAPEYFCRVILKDPMKSKKVQTGLTQLSHEGVIQLFYRPAVGRQDPWLGAVGMLQFEVLKERLKNEYNVRVELERLRFNHARWIGGDPEGLAWLQGRRDYVVVVDRNDQPVVLAETPWMLEYARDHAPGLVLYDVEPL